MEPKLGLPGIFGLRRKVSARLLVALIAPLLLCDSTRGESLEELLKPDAAAVLAEDAGARVAWNGVVEAFRKNDFTEAKRRGEAFLGASYQATPYQVLGVQVMLSLSAGEAQARTTLDRKSSGDLAVLEKEHDEILLKLNTQRRIEAEADGVINKLTQNRTVGVQQGSHNHRLCIIAEQRMFAAQAAIKELEVQNKEIEGKVHEKTQSANANLKGDILRLLQMLRDENEIPAAFAIANVFLRRVGTDLEVAKLQQDFMHMQKIYDRAVKVVELIRTRQRSLVEKMEYWAAKKEAHNILVTVRAQAGDREMPALVEKLMMADPLSIQVKMKAADSNAAAIVKLAESDHSVAQTKFEAFRHDFPDYPEMALLEAKVLGERSIANKNERDNLVTEIERLVAQSPEQAMGLLQTLDEKSLSVAEKQRLGVRITTVTSMICQKMLDTFDVEIRSAAALLGGGVLELVAKGSLRQTGVFSEIKSNGAQNVRLRIDKSAEKPKAIAILARVLGGVDRMKALPLDTMQRIRLDGIATEASTLQEACK